MEDSERGKPLKVAFAISAIIVMWSGSYYFVKMAAPLESKVDISTLLFGASSLALFILSITIAIVAAIGFPYIMSELRKAAEEEARKVTKPLSGELKGRVLASQGYLIGEASVEPDLIEPKDRERLDEAIRLCQQGYNLLKDVGGPAESMVLNNLVFYSCVYGDRSRRDFLLTSARRLMEEGQRHDSVNLQLTACRAILQFGRDAEEKEKAYEALLDISIKKGVADKERKEAKRYMASFYSR